MQLGIDSLIVVVAAILSIAYAVVLLRLGVIRMPKKRPITSTDEFVQFNLLRKGTNYAKTLQGVLHYDLFQREQFVNILRSLPYPIFVIFGPELCWDTTSFISLFKERDNIILYQFTGTDSVGLSNEEKMDIIEKRNQHCLIVDGAHCFVEFPHAKHEFPQGGWEFEDNVSVASEYEQNFDLIVRYSKEVNREHVMESVGIDNITIYVDQGYRKVTALSDGRARELLQRFADAIGEQKDFVVLWNRRLQTSKSRSD